MKGLLLKDFYMLIYYGKVFLLLMLVFLVAGTAIEQYNVFLFFPCLFAGILPMTLQAYDERSGWCHFSGTLPYTRAQLVSVKYLFALLLGGAVVLLTTVLFVLSSAPVFSLPKLLALLAAAGTVTLLVPALLLPFVFRFGSEKGRIAYLILVGGLCAGGLFFLRGGQGQPSLPGWAGPGVFFGAAMLLFAGSWLLSVSIYQARESV